MGRWPGRAHLTDRQRDTFERCAGGALTPRELARERGVSEDAVRQLVAVARDKLRALVTPRHTYKRSG